MNRLTFHLKATWGVWSLGLVTLLALFRGFAEETPGHFRMFMGASQALWTGGQAYDVPFLGNLFFYSPSSAMFVYGPFALLPERLGLLLYLFLSGAAFVWGARRFAIARLAARSQWALAALAPALFSSLVAHKLEVLSVGILLGAASGEFRGRAGAWIGSITQWKYQALPVLGLLSLERWVTRRQYKGALAAIAAILAWTLLPFLFQDSAYLLEQQRLMKDSLSRYSSQSFAHFDNLYSFLRHALGIEMSYAFSQVLAGVSGLACAAVLIWKARRTQLESDEAVMLALVLGSSFTVLFSPLQQVSAYVLLAPVWLLAIGRPGRKLSGTEVLWLSFLWCAMTFGYSEFIPTELRQWLRSRSARTLFAAALSLWLVVRLLRDQTPVRSAPQTAL